MIINNHVSLLVLSNLMFFASSYVQGTVVNDHDQPVKVGNVENIVIDGNPDDWHQRGLQLNILTSHDNFSPSPDDFHAKCRFGWDRRGILVLAEVHDDFFAEADNTSDIWRQDGIEIFLAEETGSENRLQLLIAPGMDTKHPKVRSHLNLLSKNKPENIDHFNPQVARMPSKDGYTLEALIPWQLLNLTSPTLSRTPNKFGLQIIFNDVDQDGNRGQLVWFPSVKTYADSHQMTTVILDGNSSIVNMLANSRIKHLNWLIVDVKAIPDMVGNSCYLVGNLDYPQRHKISPQTLDMKNGYAQTQFRIPIDVDKLDSYQLAIHCRSNESTRTRIKLPDIGETQKELMTQLALRFEPSTIFKNAIFPTCEFAQPLIMGKLLGDYTIQTQYYDASCSQVAKPTKPGRYGAVIKISSSKTGITHTRYRTLYRMPVNVDPWDMSFAGDIQLPDAYGINPQVVKDHQQTVNEFVNWSFWDIAQNASFNAALLASLSQMEPGVEATVYNGVQTLEKQYWTTLERKLNHNDTMFTREFALPQKSDKPATMVHTGSMSEAGMTGDAPQKIDALLTEWANDTDEPFIACVIRNGVIVHHKAYGKRDDKPMTTQTRSWMASLSKLISGTMVMMMVDQHLINLDTPIDRYLPELQNAGFNQIPTIRNLWTHTAGFTSHRGEDDPDLEHLIASIAPYVKVGNKYEYDGMGLELGIQLLGQVSGECYPLMVKKHLLDPLDCNNTDCQNASWNTQSTAMDMAKIGQMLLNGGSYGPYRFMSEETRDAMLPIDMATLTEGRSTNQYGIGTSWYTGDGLSDRCFAHGAASSATLRIDLKHNLVISMTRNAAGKNFGKYHPQFIQTVTGCMLENQRVER